MIRAAHKSLVALTDFMRGEFQLSYVENNLVAGETLRYQTRHHWIVLLGPLLVSLLLGVLGLGLLVESIASNSRMQWRGLKHCKRTAPRVRR